MLIVFLIEHSSLPPTTTFLIALRTCFDTIISTIGSMKVVKSWTNGFWNLLNFYYLISPTNCLEKLPWEILNPNRKVSKNRCVPTLFPISRKELYVLFLLGVFQGLCPSHIESLWSCWLFIVFLKCSYVVITINWMIVWTTGSLFLLMSHTLSLTVKGKWRDEYLGTQLTAYLTVASIGLFPLRNEYDQISWWVEKIMWHVAEASV